MNEKHSFSPPAVGGSSLIVIFAVLCLTVFALLSLSTAQSSAGISDAAAQTVIGYYEADYQAEQILAQLRSGRCPDGVELRGDTAYYSCPISDTQALFVAVTLDGDQYEIKTWRVESTQTWSADDHLAVWQGSGGA